MSKFVHKHLSKLKKIGKADLHIHSNFSDGKPSIEEILDYVQNHTDLDVIAIADHDTIEGAKYAQELVKNKNYRFDVILAEEISSEEGHIIGLFLTEQIKPGQSAVETAKQIKKQGGISIAAHPFFHTKLFNEHMVVMNGIGPLNLFKAHHSLDAVEIVNATPTLADENISAALMNRSMLFRSETGSSDAHILEAIGRAYTAFEGKSASDLKKALKHRQTQAIFTSWTALALIKYLFFFIPIGLRLLWFNINRHHESWLEPF